MDAWRMQQLHVVEYFYVRKCFSWPATCNPWYPDQAVDEWLPAHFFWKCMGMGMAWGFRKSKHNSCSFSMLNWEHFQQILGGIWIAHLAAAGVLIAMKLPHGVMLWYCWWKKSCTSWYSKYPLSTGFYTSQVVRISSINSMCLLFFGDDFVMTLKRQQHGFWDVFDMFWEIQLQ